MAALERSDPGAAAGPRARALVLNVGSGTLKWTLFGLPGPVVEQRGAAPWRGDRAGQLRELLAGLPPPAAAGHRIVHGGQRFRGATLIDRPAREALRGLSGLDPLHMEPALLAVDVVAAVHPRCPQVAAFDTAFHATLPAAAACYALPHEWTERFGLRRFGFHGLSVHYAVRRAAALLPAARRLVVCHLGSGCSVTAVRDGASVDTTMGFSPMEGLMMATRSGSVDPGVLLHLQLRHGFGAADLRDALEQRSGLLGLSGLSADLREVTAAAQAGAPRAALARERFVLDVRRAVGRMAGVLGRVDALVFTGGIGENDAGVRAEAAAALEGHGLQLDADANRAPADGADLAQPGSPVRVMVVHCREDEMILEQMLDLQPALAGGAA